MVGLAFQNCAAPLDPSLLEDAELTSVTPNPNETFAFNVEVVPTQIDAGGAVNFQVNHASSSRLLTFEYTRNGIGLGDSSEFARAENVTRDDSFRITILDNGVKVGERDIIVSVNDVVTEPPVEPPVQPTGEVVIKKMSGTNAINYVGDGVSVKLQVQPDASQMSTNDVLGTTLFEWEVKTSISGSYTIQNEPSRTFTVAPSYLNEATYVRVRGYNNLSGKWSPYISMTIYTDYYKASLTTHATKAPRNDLAQAQCEVPYFVSGVYTHYYSASGSKVGQKIIGLRCKLIRDEETPDAVRGVGKVSPTDAVLDKGRIKAFGGNGSWYYGGVNLTGPQNEFITGINPDQSGTSYVVYNSPQKSNDEVILLTGGVTLKYEADKTNFAECPTGTHLTGIEKVGTGSSSRLFSSTRYYYKYNRLLCGRINKIR